MEMIGAWAPEAAKALGRIGCAFAFYGFGAGSATLLQEACVVVRFWRVAAASRVAAIYGLYPDRRLAIDNALNERLSVIV